MDQLTALLSQLIEIDSVNPSLVPGGAGELEIAQFVAGWLQNAGLEVTLDEFSPGRANVIAVAHGQATGPKFNLILNAHLDTVGVTGMENPHKAYLENGRLYGRGALDTKGGLAAFMLAAAQAVRLGLNGDIILTAVADEEHASLGTEALLGRWHANAAIVAEPTDLRIITAHKGFSWLEIETQGFAAHGSMPQVGIDAIAKMGKVLVGLENLSRQLARRQPHPLLGTGSLHASLIQGGQELSSYPARCRLSIERRNIPGETRAQIEAEIQTILTEIAATDPTFKASSKLTFERQPLEVPSDTPIVQSLLKQGARILGYSPQIAGFSGWTDAALLNAANIPAVIFGPSGEGLHGVVEWVDLASVQKCSEITLAVMEDLCA
jgi:acetylornithine deacetylase